MVCHSLVCSRFCLPFLLRWVPGARSGRKRCLLLSIIWHLSGWGLSAVLAQDLLGAVVTSFWVVATGVDLDDKEGCSSTPWLLLRSIDAWRSALLEAGIPPDRFAFELTIWWRDWEITGSEQSAQVSTAHPKSCVDLEFRGAALTQRCCLW